MLKNEPTHLLTPELEMDLLDDYSVERLASRWNPALAKVQLLKRPKQEEAEPLMEYLPGHYWS